MENDIDFFNKNKYIKVENALTKREASLCAVAIQYDALQRPNQTYDIITPETQTRYASPMSESILFHIQNIVESKTGLSLLPTYSYNRIYKPGDFLKKHVDRASCEISATINLGYLYNTNDPSYTWNIWVGGKEFVTEPGDLLIYRGMELEHWRDEFVSGEGSWQVQAFLHWVDANGPYKDFMYDGRPSLGYELPYRVLPAGFKDWSGQKE